MTVSQWSALFQLLMMSLTSLKWILWLDLPLIPWSSWSGPSAFDLVATQLEASAFKWKLMLVLTGSPPDPCRTFFTPQM